MKTLISCLLLLVGVAEAKIELPYWANEKCVMGVVIEFANDQDHTLLENRHKESVVRELSHYYLFEKQKQYVVFEKDRVRQAPIQAEFAFSIAKTDEKTISCKLSINSREFGKIEFVRTAARSQIEDISRQFHTACFDVIRDSSEFLKKFQCAQDFKW